VVENNYLVNAPVQYTSIMFPNEGQLRKESKQGRRMPPVGDVSGVCSFVVNGHFWGGCLVYFLV
jgi:hypothetical protein